MIRQLGASLCHKPQSPSLKVLSEICTNFMRNVENKVENLLTWKNTKKSNKIKKLSYEPCLKSVILLIRTIIIGKMWFTQ